MNADEITRLKEIAGKATQGKWHMSRYCDDMVSSEEFQLIAQTAGHRANAAHIAAFDPPTVLSLLTALEQLQAGSVRLSEILIEKSQEIAALRARLEAAKAIMNRVLAANDEFRAQLPDDWEGDPLDDVCKEARAAIAEMEGK